MVNICFHEFQVGLTSARVTNLFAEELQCEKRTMSTRASAPIIRDCSLFGSATHQHGLERMIMLKTDLMHKHAMKGLAVEMLWQEDGHWWPATIMQVGLSLHSIANLCSFP